MTYLYSINLWLHIVFASIALVLFWVPICTKKGQLNHRRFGHYYKTAMYVVVVTGIVMASMLLNKQFVSSSGLFGSNHTDASLAAVQSFAVFLIYLALLIFISTRHGIAVLAVKDKREKLRKPAYALPVATLFIFGIVLVMKGTNSGNVLHIVFGILGAVLSFGILRYCFKTEVLQKQWLLEHIGSMIGSGIAAYTAFLTFGGRTLLSDFGQWQLVFWIAPGVIGGIVSYLVCRHYAALFNINKSKQISAKTV